MADRLDEKRERAVELLLDRVIESASNAVVSGEELDKLTSAYATCSEELEYARGDGRSNPGL